MLRVEQRITHLQTAVQMIYLLNPLSFFFKAFSLTLPLHFLNRQILEIKACFNSFSVLDHYWAVLMARLRSCIIRLN